MSVKTFGAEVYEFPVTRDEERLLIFHIDSTFSNNAKIVILFFLLVESLVRNDIIYIYFHVSLFFLQYFFSLTYRE